MVPCYIIDNAGDTTVPEGCTCQDGFKHVHTIKAELELDCIDAFSGGCSRKFLFADNHQNDTIYVTRVSVPKVNCTATEIGAIKNDDDPPKVISLLHFSLTFR